MKFILSGGTFGAFFVCAEGFFGGKMAEERGPRAILVGTLKTPKSHVYSICISFDYANSPSLKIGVITYICHIRAPCIKSSVVVKVVRACVSCT